MTTDHTEYRDLRADEIIHPGDQWYAPEDDRWHTADVMSAFIGRTVAGDRRWRRQVGLELVIDMWLQ